VRSLTGPSASSREGAPSRQKDAKQRAPAVEITRDQKRHAGIKSRGDLVHPSVLAIGTVTDVGAVNREHVERSAAIVKSCDDQRAFNPLSGEATEFDDREVFDVESGQQTEPQVPFSKCSTPARVASCSLLRLRCSKR